MSSKELVLLTGGTGHLGFATLVEALRKGYHVRAAVRGESAANRLKAAKSIQPHLTQISFVIVPDITAEGAYDEHVKGVDYIVHLASPIPSNTPTTDYEKDIVTPAVKGTVGILHSALKEPKVKRIVITASSVSVKPQDSTAPSYSADDVVPDIHGPFTSAFPAYVASKVRAHNAVRAFIATQNPSFGVVNIMPPFVIGPKELAQTPEEVVSGCKCSPISARGRFSNVFSIANSVVLLPILGKAGVPISSTVHLNDIAFIHVAALNTENTKINQKLDNFGCSGASVEEFLEINSIVRKQFPDAVKKGILASNGEINVGGSPVIDKTRAEEVFDFKFKGLEKQIVDVVEYYLQVHEKESRL